MKIKSVELRKFRRFSNLQITDIPQRAKLVVLVGTNGTGKSSLFDAFSLWKMYLRNTGAGIDEDYHQNTNYLEVNQPNFNFLQNTKIDFHDFTIQEIQQNEKGKKAFYIRSPYRHEADFAINEMRRSSEILNDDRHPAFMINQDSRVSDNYQRLVSETIDFLYTEDDDEIIKKDVRDRLIKEIKK